MYPAEAAYSGTDAVCVSARAAAGAEAHTLNAPAAIAAPLPTRKSLL